MSATAAPGTVTVLDAHSYNIEATIKVGKRPWGIVLSPDGKFLFSANGPSNDVSVVDLAQGKEIARIKAGDEPLGRHHRADAVRRGYCWPKIKTDFAVMLRVMPSL